ncbi:MAG: DegT/DnrJ/EryC1/StrS family aminotransferase [Planctomycetes bacterium]|nr:DegT/DnrJ/EryC1/StrS family aminotransferase [Planctomycetota bacterium]
MPTLGQEEQKALAGTLHSNYLAQGERVRAFEKAIACYHHLSGAVATNSGTSALHLCLLGMGIKPGDEAIIPSYVCPAVLNAVNYTGAKAVLADIDESFNLCPDSTQRKITGRTKAIIVPHLFGIPAQIDKFMKLGVPVIEDCAQSIGATYNGKKVGTFGHAAIFSFYATKMLTTAGHGGAVASNDTKFILRIRNLRDFDECDDYKIRYNYQMTDLEAAVGLVQLKKLPGFIRKRQQTAHRYNQALSSLTLSPSGRGEGEGVRLPIDTGIFYRYVLRHPQANRIIKYMNSKGIETKRPVYKPLHHYLGLSAKDFPVTEKTYRTAFSLPIYPSLTGKQTDYIIENVQKCIQP